MNTTKKINLRSLKLLSSNTKLEKSLKKGWLQVGLQLAPHTQGGRKNVCPSASAGCAASCLFSAGMGKFANVRNARIRKTQMFFDNRKDFMSLLVTDIFKAQKIAEKHNLKLAIRLNTLSDLPWESIKVEGKTLFEMFPSIQFMDYTKIATRMNPKSKAQSFSNYHLTFSRSECNDEQVEKVISWGGNVAVVFNELPSDYLGRKVVDGDESDLRFLDGENVVVGLLAKGSAKNDESGFVVKVKTQTKGKKAA